MKRNSFGMACAVLLTLTISGGCSRSGMLQPDLEASAASAVLGGNNQRALAGSVLEDPITVQVLDAAGRPVERQAVNFVVTRGGGRVYVGMALTSAQGIAREWWTLGPEPGENVIEVRAIDRATGRPVVLAHFHATGLARGER